MKYKSIASRIIFSIIPILAVSTAVFVLLSYFVTKYQINNTINDRMRAGLESAQLRMQVEFDRNAAVATNMALTTEIFDIKNTNPQELKTYIRDIVIQNISSNKNTVSGGVWLEPYLLEKQKYYSSFVFMNNEKAVFVEDYSEGGANDFHQAEWYINGKNAPKKKVAWSGLYYDPIVKIDMVTATRPMYDKKGRFIGVTTADMALTDIRSITNNITVGKTGRAFLLSEKGEMISHYNPDPDFVPDETVKSHLMSRWKGVYKYDDKGNVRRVYFDSIPAMDWVMGISIEEKEIGTTLLNLLLLLTVLPVLGLGAGTVSIILTAKYFKRIVDKVNTFAEQAPQGDFSERIEVTEKDEFGYMEQQLNAMMSKLADMNAHSAHLLQLANNASKAKSDFLSRMSHEIRTPMNAIIGMTQIAQKSQDINKIKDAVSKISTASYHLLSLINDILDMSKIEADKLELVAENFDIEAALDNVINVISFKAEEKKQTLRVTKDEKLPRFLTGDELRFSQVLTNLLGNAVKFTPQRGYINLDVKVEEETGDDYVLKLTVHDSGIGLTPDQQKKLFMPFEQAEESIARKYGGTGLGLAISKRIVEMMSGKIWVESELGKGSKFIFTVKMKKGHAVEPKPSLANTQIFNGDFTGKTVLLAEDVEINREIAISLLEDTGLGIECAENGKLAYDMFKNEPDKYDLILMDIQMPLMDGLQTTVAIRAIDNPKAKTVPIIAMTANAFKEDEQASLKAGMNDHISKPIDYNVLIEKLKHYLR